MKTFWQRLKSVTAIVAVGVLIAHLVLDSGAAWAARSGGRVGGGSFSRPAPTRSYRAPRSDYGGYAQPVPVYGGGFGFPFLIPFFGFGGGFGGLFTIIMIGVLANVLISTFRNFRNSRDDSEIYADNPPVSLHTLQVGLLAQARELQEELNQLALTARIPQSPGGSNESAARGNPCPAAPSPILGLCPRQQPRNENCCKRKPPLTNWRLRSAANSARKPSLTTVVRLDRRRSPLW